MPLEIDPNRFAGGPQAGDTVDGQTQVQPNPAFLAGAAPSVVNFTDQGGVDYRQGYTTMDGTHVIPSGALPHQPPVGGA